MNETCFSKNISLFHLLCNVDVENIIRKLTWNRKNISRLIIIEI